MTKHEHSEAMQAEWEALQRALGSVEQRLPAGSTYMGPADPVLHAMVVVNGWDSTALEWLGRVERTEPLPSFDAKQLEAINSESAQRRRGWKRVVIEGECENTHIRLLHVVRAFPDELWNSNAGALHSWLPELTTAKYRRHRQQLEEQLKNVTA